MVHNRHIRSLISVTVALLLIGAISYLGVHTYQASHAATGPTIYASPAAATVENGSTLSISIREDSGIEAINSVQTTMNYDPGVLEFTSITEGGAFPVVAATSTTTPGVIRVARAISDGTLTGDKPIVTVNFKVIGTSGSGAVSFDKAYSYLVRGSDSKDVLQNVGSGNYTVNAPAGSVTPNPAPPAVSSKPTLYINPPTGTYARNATITAEIRINTHAASVTTIEAALKYPTQQLQYIGVSENGPFITKQRSSAANGIVDVIRSISGGSTPVQGDESVVSVSFKVIGTDGTANLSFTSSSAAFDSSGSGENILDLAGSGGAAYTLSQTAPLTLAPGTASSVPTTITSPGQAVSITSGGTDGRAAITTAENGTSMTEVSGTVTLAPLASNSADGSVDPISKVEYYIDGKLIATKSSQPFTYKFDSTSKPNGTYTLDVKTYYVSGRVDSRTDKIVVRNQLDAVYFVRNYGSYFAAVTLVLALLAVVVWRLTVAHRFQYHFSAPADTDAVYAYKPPVAPPAGHGPTAPDPTVIAPSNAAAPVPEPSLAASASAMTTPALPINNAATPTIVKHADAPAAAPPAKPAPATPVATPTPAPAVPPTPAPSASPATPQAPASVPVSTSTSPQSAEQSEQTVEVPAPSSTITPTVVPFQQTAAPRPTIQVPVRSIDGIAAPIPPHVPPTGTRRPGPM